jgi:hypothetical protein
MMPRTFGMRLEPRQARRAANPRQINIVRKNGRRMTPGGKSSIVLLPYSAM